MPIAFVGVVGQRRVTLTANQGLQLVELGRDPGLCVTTIAGAEPHVVPDTHLNPLAARHPLVHGPAAIRFYAGVPLTTADGFNLGTLCVADTRPRNPNKQDLTLLQDVASLLMSDLEAALLHDVEDEVFRLGEILRSMPVAHFTCTLDGTITTWSEAAETLFGYESHQIIGQHVSLLARASASGESTATLARVAARETVDWFDTVRVTRSGEPVETQDTVYPLLNQAGDVVAANWVSRDVSELKRLDALVWESRERFETVLDTIGDAVVMTDVAGNVEYLNPVAQELTGWTTATARGKTAQEVVDVAHRLSMERSEHPVQLCLRQESPVGLSNHLLLVHRDGRTFAIEDVVAPVRHRDGTVIGTVMVFRDTHAGADSLNTSAYLGNQDELTGLPNRLELENQIERALVTAARENVEHTLLLLSVTGYTAVQVQQGRVAAGELLKQMAVLLRTQFREIDTLARLENEQFAVLLGHCPPAQARRIAIQLQKVVRDYTFVWERQSIPVGLRVSMLAVDADVRNASALLDALEVEHDLAPHRPDTRSLDIAPPEILPASSSVHVDSDTSLTRALLEDRFRLYAQKIVPLLPSESDEHLYEFLVHMLDEDGRLLQPSVFIEAAARDHLDGELDRWVVRSALRSLSLDNQLQASVWMINLSQASLADETFPAFVQSQLNRKGVPPDLVCFELSEATAIEHLSTVVRFVDAVKRIGCQVSLSQFGTSLHGFAYLRNLNVDYLKIDGSVIRDITDDAIDRAVVGAIGHIAHVMGIRTVAEHVEDIAVLECLKDLGIDYAQGYAIAKPLPLTILS